MRHLPQPPSFLIHVIIQPSSSVESLDKNKTKTVCTRRPERAREERKRAREGEQGKSGCFILVGPLLLDSVESGSSRQLRQVDRTSAGNDCVCRGTGWGWGGVGSNKREKEKEMDARFDKRVLAPLPLPPPPLLFHRLCKRSYSMDRDPSITCCSSLSTWELGVCVFLFSFVSPTTGSEALLSLTHRPLVVQFIFPFPKPPAVTNPTERSWGGGGGLDAVFLAWLSGACVQFANGFSAQLWEKKEENCLLRRAGRKDAVCDWAYKNSMGLVSPTWLHPVSCEPADGGCPLAITGNKKWWRKAVCVMRWCNEHQDCCYFWQRGRA